MTGGFSAGKIAFTWNMIQPLAAIAAVESRTGRNVDSTMILNRSFIPNMLLC